MLTHPERFLVKGRAIGTVPPQEPIVFRIEHFGNNNAMYNQVFEGSETTYNVEEQTFEALDVY